MINLHEKFLEQIDQINENNLFSNNIQEDFSIDTFSILTKTNLIEAYYISSNKFNSLFAELFKISLVDWNNLVSFLNMTVKLSSSIIEKSYMLKFYKNKSDNFNSIVFSMISLGIFVKIDLENEKSIKEGFDLIKKTIYDTFELIIHRSGFNINTITSKEINLINNLSIGDYVRRNNNINGLNYMCFYELLNINLNLDTANYNKIKKYIIFKKDNINYLYNIFSYILPLEYKKLRQIIELYKFYCHINNRAFEIIFDIEEINKNQTEGNLYYITLPDFLVFKIGPNFFINSEPILYSFETFNIFINHSIYSWEKEKLTNSTEEMYNSTLKVFLNQCSKVLGKEVNKIKYTDLEIIKILTL